MRTARSSLLLLGLWLAHVGAQTCEDQLRTSKCVSKVQARPARCNKLKFQLKCPNTCRTCSMFLATPCQNLKPKRCAKFTGPALTAKCRKAKFASKCKVSCSACGGAPAADPVDPGPLAPVFYLDQSQCDVYRDGASASTGTVCYTFERWAPGSTQTICKPSFGVCASNYQTCYHYSPSPPPPVPPPPHPPPPRLPPPLPLYT